MTTPTSSSSHYYVCGLNAYKWLPYGAIGACTLARLTRATWVWENNDLPYRQMPKHLLYKRNTIPKAKEQISLPWEQKFDYEQTLVGLSVKNVHTIEDLAELFDNVTDYVFDALNNTNAITQQLILVTNQHAMVLDYLTASQGGLCQVVGPACCHYLNSDGVFQIQHDIEQARKVKEEFRKRHIPKLTGILIYLNVRNGSTRQTGLLHTAGLIIVIDLAA